MRYAPGKNNIADLLSHLLQIQDIRTINAVYESNLVMFVKQLVPQAVTLSDIHTVLTNNIELSQICEDLRLGRDINVKPYFIINSELCVDEILLLGSRIIVPFRFKIEFCRMPTKDTLASRR